jgi:hypothetical protein
MGSYVILYATAYFIMIIIIISVQLKKIPQLKYFGLTFIDGVNKIYFYILK